MKVLCPFHIFTGELVKIKGCHLAFISFPQVSVSHFITYFSSCHVIHKPKTIRLRHEKWWESVTSHLYSVHLYFVLFELFLVISTYLLYHNGTGNKRILHIFDIRIYLTLRTSKTCNTNRFFHSSLSQTT